MRGTILLDFAFDPADLERYRPSPVEGLLREGSYRAVDGELPYLSIYEYRSFDDLLAAAKGAPPSKGSEPLEQIPAVHPVQRRVYASRGEDFMAPGYAPDLCPYLVVSSMSVRPDYDDDLNAWYTQEHIPGLLRIDGWLRSRRFERLAGPGSKHLALHDLTNLDLRKSPEFEEIMNTPWRLRLAEQRTSSERNLYRVR